jgi:hypothetical protein
MQQLKTLDRIANFRFDTFDPKREEWRYYFDRFSLEIELLQLGSAELASQRRNLLLRCLGPEIYRLVADHFDPETPTNVAYDDLVSFLTSYYTPASSYLQARLRFGQCVRSSDQSISQFINTLRSAATGCKFGTTLDERLRDQFLIGLNNPTMLEEIFKTHGDTEKVTLTQVEKSALVVESAQKQCISLSTPNEVQVHKVSFSNANAKRDGTKSTPNFQSKGKSKPNADKQNATAKDSKLLVLNPRIHCLRCGKNRHGNLDECKASHTTCRACGKLGHYDRACVASGRAYIDKNKPNETAGKVHTVKLPTDNEFHGHLYNIFAVTHSGGSYVVNVFVNQHFLPMEYDTAADVSIIGSDHWKNIGSPNLSPTINLGAYPHTRIKVLGEFNATVRVGKKTFDLPLVVAKEAGSALFGKNWISAFNLCPGEHSVNNFVKYVPRNAISSNVQNVVSVSDNDVSVIMLRYNELFSGKHGIVRNFFAKFELSDDAVPKISKPRSVPLALKTTVLNELERQVKDNIIERVDVMSDPIEWASPLVIQPKKPGKVRICADLKASINK